MNKSIKILINILVFLLIGGFVWYMIHTVNKDESPVEQSEVLENDDFISPYRLVSSFETKGTIRSFDLYKDHIYVSAKDSVFVFDLSGTEHHHFSIAADHRDMIIKDDRIYLLYPARIEIYTLSGEKLKEWEACSEHSDYCSMTLSTDYIFVTDAENKNICQYTREGNFIKFIKSPKGFIIPSYSFDIINMNDTLYCANSGRHSIESYTLNGDFITAFGTSGEEAGAFAGCCNPAYLAQTSRGDILASEKGIPRISCYGKNGKFRTILFNSKLLGGGNTAYEVKIADDYIFTAGNKQISIFRFDPELAEQSSCAGCTADCPMRENISDSRFQISN
ncbi:MAG: hypothetical protein LBV74_17290 [Tannerella sp.]|jgi:hypothetical protein|nr:hypothetical protein [Tannerella sp.]